MLFTPAHMNVVVGKFFFNTKSCKISRRRGLYIFIPKLIFFFFHIWCGSCGIIDWTRRFFSESRLEHRVVFTNRAILWPNDGLIFQKNIFCGIWSLKFHLGITFLNYNFNDSDKFAILKIMCNGMFFTSVWFPTMVEKSIVKDIVVW